MKMWVRILGLSFFLVREMGVICLMGIGFRDDSYPLYHYKNCPFVDQGFRCSENGRPDLFYTKWRWQPKLCNLPRDLSYNDLTGDVPPSFERLEKIDYIYLTGNKLNGTIPSWVLVRNKNVDLSNNNFTWESSSPAKCPRGSVTKIHPFLKRNFPCSASKQQHRYSLHINCGGKEAFARGERYEADREGASMFYTGKVGPERF